MAKKQPARQKHVPLRSCVVCRQRFEKRRLTRIVNTADSGVVVDPTGKLNGRGAYLCDQPACWEKALRYPGIINQALHSQVTEAELAAIGAAAAVRLSPDGTHRDGPPSSGSVTSLTP